MADILIRGMDKPFNCFACDLSYPRGERLFCCVTKDEVIRSKIASDCPIIELPEHGDLIDREWLKGMAYSKVEDFGGAFLDTIDIAIAPVVIPSNKEETE